MMILFKLIVSISTIQLAHCCFCPPPITPSCGCSSSNYASSPSYQPQTIFYANPIPVAGPIQTQYGQPPPIYVQSTYYPVANQYPPQPGYLTLPHNPYVMPNQIPSYNPQPPVPNPYKQPTTVFSPNPVIPSSVNQANAISLPQQPSPLTKTITNDPSPVDIPVQQTRQPSIPEDFGTEDDFEIMRVAQTTSHPTFRTTTISSITETEFFTQSPTVDQVEEFDITESTTDKPHETTTRIVPIPRKEGDGKSDDYEYFYIYYDDDKNQTTVDKNKITSDARGKTVGKDSDFEDFDDNTRDVAKETSITDAGKVELDGTDYNVLEVNAIRRNIKTNYADKTTRTYNEKNEEAEKVPTPSPYPEDDYEEYEVEEFVPVNPDGSEGKPQIIKFLTTTISPVNEEQGIYKRANNFHGISKTSRTRMIDASAEAQPAETEKPLKKILRANRRRMNDGEIRRHPKP